jgi:membrane fusion protein, multidrug efflux system
MINNRLIRAGGVLVLLLVLAGVAAYWYYYRTYATTDDAYVSGHVGLVSPRVQGRVQEVLVDNNHFVKPDQALLTLDPTDYQVAVAQAEAALARLHQELEMKYAKVATAQAKVAEAVANLRQASIDKQRYTRLFERRTIPRETLDRTDTRYRVTQAVMDQAKREQQEALAAIGGSTSIPLEEQPAIKEAKALLEQARLNLDYTKVTAQVAGYITKRQAQPGNWVRPGQPLMVLVPLDLQELWIEANFKETQLAHVYIGQPAEVMVDAYPDTTFKGRVDSIMAGTGAAFSLLPPENATGNWVKVVQRVPVKIAVLPPFPQNRPLRLGMSVWVKIDTRNRTGARLLTERR